MLRGLALIAILPLVLCSPTAGQTLAWPDRSGPSCDGHADPVEARGLPTHWDEQSGRNIAWRIRLQGSGHSTPVIDAGRAWFTAASADGRQQFVYCVDTDSGEVRHHKLQFENPDPEPLSNEINTYASPSCVLEADAVYVHFGTYGTARLDPRTAATVWQRRDIHCRHFRGPGSSPVLVDDVLILTFDGIDQQFLMALDKHTGQTRWRSDRSTDFKDLEPDGTPRGEGDYRKAYGTPGVFKVGDRLQVASVGARAAFGYDALTGEEIWTIEHGDYNAAIRPLFLPPLLMLNTGSRSARQLALRLDDTTRGNVSKTHIVWDRTRGNAALSNPVIADGRLYMVTDTGVLHVLDARTGLELFSQRLPGDHTASPVVANGLIYFFSERGQATVIRASEQLEIVARNELAEGMRASPAVAGGALFLRTFGSLYKIATSGP